jgi:hypothetical protein
MKNIRVQLHIKMAKDFWITCYQKRKAKKGK